MRDEPSEARRRSPIVSPLPRSPRRWGGVLAVTALALLATPAASAGSAASPTSATTGVWAWGAFSNATYVAEQVGAYADSLQLTNGNLSSTDAYVAALEELHAEQGSFVVVNATAPANGTRSIVTSAVSIVNDSGLVVVTGDLPAAGTYAAHSAVPLVNTTCYYAVRLVEVTEYSVAANYSYANGSLALLDEQLRVWTGVNTTVVAYHWPTYTSNPNGTVTLRYTNSAYVTLGWVGEVVNATFAPALPVVQAPLAVGKSWNATTNVSVAGWAAYAVVAAAVSGSSNSSSASQGITSLNGSASVQFGFTVVGAQSVIFPNGTQGTGDAIATSENGASSGSFTLWDGLAVLPNGPAQARPDRPATRMDAATAGATASSGNRTIVDAAGFPVASSAGSGTSALVTAPLDPSTSSSRIAAAGTPVTPTGAVLPSTSSPPTWVGGSTPPTSGGPGTTNPPPTSNPPPSTTGPGATTPRAPAASTPLTAAYLVALVSAIVIAFLAVGLVRSRRSPP